MILLFTTIVKMVTFVSFDNTSGRLFLAYAEKIYIFTFFLFTICTVLFNPDDDRAGMDNFILFLMIRFLGYNYIFEYNPAGPIPLRKVGFKIRDFFLLDDLP